MEPYTKKEKEKYKKRALQLWREGLTFAAIARQLNKESHIHWSGWRVKQLLLELKNDSLNLDVKRSSVNPEKGKYQAIAVELRDSGLTYGGIAIAFNKRRIPRLTESSGKKWNQQAIKRLLLGTEVKAKVEQTRDAKKEECQEIASEFRELGYTYQAIADMFNSKNVPTLSRRKGSRWYAETIRQMIPKTDYKANDDNSPPV